MVPKHFVSAAAIVMNEHGEILLIKGPRRGWEMPGGMVEEGEAVKDAAIRETREECGLEIEITKFCGVFQNVSGCICNFLFLGRPVGGDLITTPECLEAGFFPVEKALEMVTWENFRQRIELCLDTDRHPFYVDF